MGGVGNLVIELYNKVQKSMVSYILNSRSYQCVNIESATKHQHLTMAREEISSFAVISASKWSSIIRRRIRLMRKLTHGHGVNDYNGTTKLAGKHKPFYRAWASMLRRCYSAKLHAKRPTYISCTVCAEWLSLSSFKAWYDDNYVDGWQLDKDLLNPSNKVYSPGACRYIPSDLNKLLLDNGAKRGVYPQGVYFDKQAGKFKAQVSVNGKPEHLGLFPTPELASAAYKKAKAAEILRQVAIYTGVVDQDVLNSLAVRAHGLTS